MLSILFTLIFEQSTREERNFYALNIHLSMSRHLLQKDMVESEMLESFWWVFCWDIAYLWCRHQLTRSMEVVQSTGLTNPERGTTWLHPSISNFYMFWSMLGVQVNFWKLQECKYLSVSTVCSSQCRQHFHSSFYYGNMWQPSDSSSPGCVREPSKVGEVHSPIWVPLVQQKAGYRWGVSATSQLVVTEMDILS